MTAGSRVPDACIPKAVSLDMNIQVDQAKVFLTQILPFRLETVPTCIRPQIMRATSGAPNASVGIGHGYLQTFILASITLLAPFKE
jgi:hypothetical protein